VKFICNPRNRLSPYTYVIEGLFGQGSLSLFVNTCDSFTRQITAVGSQTINCSPVEFVAITPPFGQTCSEYMNPYISFAGGYLTNPNANSSCQFCSIRTTDGFIGTNFNMFYDHHWRNFGFIIAFTLFNVRLLKYLFLQQLT